MTHNVNATQHEGKKATHNERKTYMSKHDDTHITAILTEDTVMKTQLDETHRKGNVK